MIESNIIPAGENNFIRLYLIEDDYRIRVYDLFGNIIFELTGDEINSFHSSFTQMLLAIQQFKVLDQQKEAVRQAIKNNSPIAQAPTTTRLPNAETPTIKKVNEISSLPLEMVTIHPRLSQEELQLCVKVIKEKQKLSRKVTISGEDLEQFILEGFDGQQVTYSRILNESGACLIAIEGIVLKNTLNSLV